MADLSGIWNDVAQSVDRLIGAGCGHLLTEDTVRWATIESLLALGVSPGQMAAERIILGTRGKLDLVVLDDPPTAIEFKFPRDSRTGTSPDTMTTGELLKDVYRLAALDGYGDRWAVMLLNDRLCQHLTNRADCRFLFNVGDQLRFDPAAFARLPPTAMGAAGPWHTAVAKAECVTATRITGHRLVAYRVEPAVAIA